MPDYAIFIPVLNEAAILRPNTLRLMEFLDGLGREYQVIIGSNGSSDQTVAEGRRLQADYPRVRFFHLPRPGPGAAFARALALCQAPLILTLDMDLSVDLDFIPRALALLRSYPVVLGSKFQGRQERTLGRVLGSGLYILCARLLLGLPYRDYSLGAKAFRREAISGLEHLIDHHTAYIGNLVYGARCRGLAIREEPVACWDRRPSRFNLLHEGLYRVGWLLRLFFRYRLPGRKP